MILLRILWKQRLHFCGIKARDTVLCNDKWMFILRKDENLGGICRGEIHSPYIYIYEKYLVWSFVSLSFLSKVLT